MAEIEVFADVSCPFAHAVLRRFVRCRDERAPDVAVRVRAWPLEFVDGKLPEAAAVEEEANGIRAAWPELFTGFDPAAFPATTLPALRLTAAAYGAGAATGEAVALDLRNRLFELGQDVGDPGVLADVASAAGLAPGVSTSDQPVQEDWVEGKARGVKGSPHFSTPEGDFFCPGLDVRRLDGTLRISADPDTFDRFVEASLRRP